MDSTVVRGRASTRMSARMAPVGVPIGSRARAGRRRGRTRLRLTLRGRITAAILAVVFAGAGLSLVLPTRAESDPGVIPVTSYTVRPGDTLWSYAEAITPRGGDVSQTVDELMRLNHMDSGALRAGQRLVVPTR